MSSYFGKKLIEIDRILIAGCKDVITGFQSIKEVIALRILKSRAVSSVGRAPDF